MKESIEIVAPYVGAVVLYGHATGPAPAFVLEIRADGSLDLKVFGKGAATALDITKVKMSDGTPKKGCWWWPVRP